MIVSTFSIKQVFPAESEVNVWAQVGCGIDILAFPAELTNTVVTKKGTRSLRKVRGYMAQPFSEEIVTPAVLAFCWGLQQRHQTSAKKAQNSPLNGTLAAGGVLFSQRLLRGPGGPFVSFLKWKETDVGMT